MKRRFLAVAALGLCFFGVASSVVGASFRITVATAQSPEGSSETIRARVTLTPTGSSSESSQPESSALPEAIAEVELAVPGTAELEVAAGTLFRLTVTAEGNWTPPQMVWVPEAGVETEVQLQPTGEVAGRLRVPRGETVPDKLTFRLVSLSSENDEKDKEAVDALAPFTCTLGETPVLGEADFVCEVPAGTLDAALRAPGFASHFLWERRLPAHGRLELGKIELRPGASVIGWVSMPELHMPGGSVPETAGRKGIEQSEVELQPVSMGVSSGTDLRRSESLERVAPVTERGFFELIEVAAGSYRLSVRHPDFAPTVLAPLEVFPGRETAIRNLELRPPARLELHLTPATDPYGRPWKIELSRKGAVPGHLDTILESAVDENGMLVAGNLDPGSFAITVSDERGSSWASDRLDLDGEVVHWIDLPVERLEAAVFLGEEPLAGAWLYFGGKYGAQRIHRMTNEEGKAYVLLPERETWVVDIESPADDLLARVEDVRVDRLPGQPWARVRLELPDTSLEGIVVDPDGRPVNGAGVRISGTKDPSFRAVSDEDGSFLARGHQPGAWILQARHALKGKIYSSELLHVQVAEGAPAGPVRLVLRPEIEITGLVVNPQGEGVPGAMVLPLVEQPEANLMNTDRREYTDVSGAFRLLLPGATGTVHLTVFPPGFAVTQATVWPEHEPTVIVPVDPGGGTVRVVLAGAEGVRAAVDEIYVFARTWIGHRFFLDQWLEAHQMTREAGELLVPDVAPGTYTACWKAPQAMWTGRPPQDADKRCVSGQVAPGGELVLRLNVEPEDRPATRAER